jgi:signal transduction histidine kinase
MRLGIRGKQVLGVTAIVALIVVVLSLMHLARLARVSLDESQARAELLANAIFHRAREVVSSGSEPIQALADDPGLRSILESSLYSKNVTYAAIVDVDGRAVVHADPTKQGQPLPSGGDLDELLLRSSIAQLQEIYASEGRTFEFRQPLLLGDIQFGSIRIGMSTLLVRDDLNEWLRPAVFTAGVGLGIAMFGAMLLSQVMLRPIHVIRSGLTRLGRGEFGVRLDIEGDDEFGELGSFFNTVSARLSADRSQMAEQVANLESAVDRLEDAVAMVSPEGELLFANPAMRALLPDSGTGTGWDALAPEPHPLRRLADETLASRQSRGPMAISWPWPAGSQAGGRPGKKAVEGTETDQRERLVLTHPVNDSTGELVGIMLIVRNLEYLSQVQSTVRYSRKLAALGRLSAGVAHEVKNPLNAMMIHLELLRQQFTAKTAPARAGAGAVTAGTAVADAPPEVTDALEHVNVIAAEIRRLDEVVQGFLKFTRPEDLRLQAVNLSELFHEVIPIVQPEAARTGVQLVVESEGAPDVNGDPAMLRQAFLNLALNACQAMPNGGTLRITCEALRGRRVSIAVADTGVGIAPEHLSRIFDLYFSTRERGSGIGLSMVYRTIQMHDGEIEVQSTPGKGTTFKIQLPQA